VAVFPKGNNLMLRFLHHSRSWSYVVQFYVYFAITL